MDLTGIPTWVPLLILAFGIPILFVHGALYRLLTPKLVTRDAYALLSITQDMRDNGHRLLTGHVPSGTVFEHVHAHPILLEWLLSFVPERYLMAVDRYFSGIMDLLFFATLSLLVPLGFLTIEQLVVVLILFLSTPEFLRPEMPHSRGLSGRKFALILTSVSLVLFLYGFSTQSTMPLGVALLFGALVFPSSKFAVQAFLAITLGLSVLVTPMAFLFFMSSFFLSVIITFGNYLEMARTHVRFSADFARNKQNIFNPFDPHLLMPSPPISSLEDFLEYIYRNKTLKMVFNNPFMIIVTAVVSAALIDGTSIPAPFGFSAWIISGTVAGILTALPGLRFLGGSERYFEYIFLPAAVVVVNSFATLGEWYGWLVGFVILLGFVVQGAYIWTYLHVFTPSDEAVTNKDKLVDFLNEQESGTLLAQPRHILRELNWRTDHNVVDFLGNNTSSIEAAREEERLAPRREVMFNLTTADTQWLADQYGPDWIIFDLERLSNQVSLSNHPDLLSIPDIEPDFRNDRYEVYSFRRLMETADGRTSDTA